MATNAEQIDEYLREWFDVTTNSTQYEIEEYADEIIVAITILLKKLKKDLFEIIDKEVSGKDVKPETLDTQWENDDQYLEFLQKNFETLTDEIQAINRIDDEIDTLNKTLKDSLPKQIEYIAALSYAYGAASFTIAGIDVDIPGMTQQQIKAILNFKYDPANEGLDKYDRIDRTTNELKSKIKQLILAYFAGRYSLDKIKKELAKLFPHRVKDDEKMGWLLNRIDTLERTELQVAALSALALRYWQGREYVNGVVYSAIWDERICPRCASYSSAFGDTVYALEAVPVFLPIHGRCFPCSDTKIKVKDGFKKIIDIKIGDFVYTHRKRYKKVTDLIRIRTCGENIICLTFKIGNRYTDISMTEDHPLLIVRNKTELWVKADDIRVGDNMLYCRDSIKHGNEFTETIVLKKKKWKLNGITTIYNFSVEDDESYVANGIVVKNCRCLWLPVIAPWDQVIAATGIEESDKQFNVSSTKDMLELQKINKKNYEQWSKIKIDNVLTVHKYPTKYLDTLLFSKTGSKFRYNKAWHKYYRDKISLVKNRKFL